MIRLAGLCLAAAALLPGGEVSLSPLFGHRERVRALAGDRDGALATWDGELRLWDAGSGRLAWQRDPLLLFDRDGVPALHVAGGRVVLAIAGTTLVYERATGRQLARLQLRTLAVSPDGGWLLHQTGDAVAWRRLDAPDADAGALPGMDAPAIAFAPDGARAWLCARDGSRLALLRRTATGWEPEPHAGPDVDGGRVAGICLLPLRSGGEALAVAVQPEAKDERAVLALLPLPLAEAVELSGTSGLGLTPTADGDIALAATAPGRLLAAGAQIDHVDAVVQDDGTLLVGRSQMGRPAVCGAYLAVAAGDQVRVESGGVAVATLARAAQSGPARSLMRSPDGRLLWAAHDDGLVCWDLALLQLRSVARTGRLETPLLPAGHPRYAVCQEAAADGDAGGWRLVDLAGRSDPVAVRGDAPAPPAVAADGSVAVAVADGRVRAWTLPSGDEIGSGALPEAGFPPERTAVAVSAGGQRMLVARAAWADGGAGGEDTTIPQRWDVRVFALPAMQPAGSAVLQLPQSAGEVRVDADGDGWALRLEAMRVRLRADGAEVGRDDEAYAGMERPVASAGTAGGAWYARLPAAIDARGLVCVGSGDGRVRLLSGDGAWAIWSTDGSFDGSRSAARVLAAAIDRRPAALEEAAPWANRPDRLLRQLGCDDEPLLQAAAKPASRRVVPAGERPAAVVASRRVEAGRLVVGLRADAGRRIAVRQDGVPAGELVADAAGAAVAEVPLDRGIAALELVALDGEGRPGIRTVEPVPGGAPAAGRLVAACLGVSRYRQEQLALRYAAKDAIDLALALGDDGGRHAVRFWIDEQVVSAALDEVRAHLAQAGPADTVVLSLAGHGLYVADPSPTWRFLPWDADPEHPDRTGIAWSRIAALFDGCAARRRLVILDTCESGALEDDRIAGAGLAVAGARGLRGPLARVPIDGLAREFAAGDRSRFVTADLGAGIGAVVLASSRGGEASYESEADRNGLFTATLLAGLRGAADADGDGAVAADELLRWTAGETARRSGDLQHPTIDRDNPAAGIRLPVLPPRE